MKKMEKVTNTFKHGYKFNWFHRFFIRPDIVNNINNIFSAACDLLGSYMDQIMRDVWVFCLLNFWTPEQVWIIFASIKVTKVEKVFNQVAPGSQRETHWVCLFYLVAVSMMCRWFCCPPKLGSFWPKWLLNLLTSWPGLLRLVGNRTTGSHPPGEKTQF